MITELNNTADLVLNDKDSKEKSIKVSNVKAKKLIYNIVKRSFDIVSGLVGILLLIPIAIVIKIISICSGDFNSIFYSQNRIGKNGKIFKLYKFRSMIPNADKELEVLLKNNKELAEEYKKMKKLNNDPRITRIGSVLRKTSIDELPQMINVFLGDMTLVGNRPYLPREKEDMKNYYNDIIKTKPGLTGFWQVSLRSRGTFEQRLKLEKYYSNNLCLKLDVQILLKTINVIFRCDNDAK